MTDQVERVAQGLDHLSIYKEARERMMRDMTGSDIDHHLVIVAGEHAAIAAMQREIGLVDVLKRARDRLYFLGDHNLDLQIDIDAALSNLTNPRLPPD